MTILTSVQDIFSGIKTPGRTYYLLTVGSGACGLYTGILDFLGSETPLYVFWIYILVSIWSGMFIGLLAVRRHSENRKMLIKYDRNGNLRLAEQRIFYLAFVPMLISFVLNMRPGIGYSLTMSLYNGGLFMAGLAAGLFKLSLKSARSSLLFCLIPIAFSSVYLYISEDKSIIMTVIVSALICFISGLLLLNEMLLGKKLYEAKYINIKGLHKIRMGNRILVMGLVVIFLIGLLLKDFFDFLFSIINDMISVVYGILARLSEWLTRDNFKEIPLKADTYEQRYTEIPLMAYILIIAAIISILIPGLIVLVKAAKHIHLPRIRIKKRCKIFEEEFIEEVSIVKDRHIEANAKRYMFTRQGLMSKRKSGEIIRYLYGFIIERLYRETEITIKNKTPLEIYDSIMECKNGGKIALLGFWELTEKYRQVRYGNKNIEIDWKIISMARKYERYIIRLK